VLVAGCELIVAMIASPGTVEEVHNACVKSMNSPIVVIQGKATLMTCDSMGWI
jgi:hypothetical protein